MIEKNTYIYKKNVTRILQVDPTSKRINILDNRFYTRNGEYYPSVTNILQFFPKNKYFEDWLKDVGHNATFIAKKAADEGTQVHEAIEKYVTGEKIVWLDEEGYSNYSLDIWKMILKFHDFWTSHTPSLIESEIHLFSDEFKYAGTCDLILEINGEKWLIDIKTSNSLHTSQELQLAAYAQAWNENFQEKIDRMGILWLKSSKRGPTKGKIQGKGWELYESSRSFEENLKIFHNIHSLFKLEHPNPSPIQEQYSTEIQIDHNIYNKVL
jgi:hypothetical protein